MTNSFKINKYLKNQILKKTFKIFDKFQIYIWAYLIDRFLKKKKLNKI